LTTDGGYIVGGTSSSDSSGDKTSGRVAGPGSYDFDYWILKLDSVGNIQWQKTIGGTQPDALYTLSQSTDGGYIVGGSSYSSASGDKTDTCWGFVNYWILKLDASGNIQWQKDLGGDHFDQLYSFIQTKDGGYLAAGQSSTDSGYVLGGSTSSGISGDKDVTGYGVYSDDYWIVKLRFCNGSSVSNNVS